MEGGAGAAQQLLGLLRQSWGGRRWGARDKGLGAGFVPRETRAAQQRHSALWHGERRFLSAPPASNEAVPFQESGLPLTCALLLSVGAG